MYLIVKSGSKLADNSVQDKQADRYLSTLDSYYSFVAEFPESHYLKELDRLAAQFGRNILKDEIKWSQHKAMSYLSTIELRGIDRTGILLDLAKTVSEDFSINIRQINIQTHDNIFEGTISLYVKDAEGLHAIMDKIRKIKGIDTVKRNQD